MTPSLQPVHDRLQRPLQDLRLSVIDRCNFRCSYCMPAEVFGPDYAFLPQAQLMSVEEMQRLVRAMVELGVTKLRLTGGEPLLRRDIVEIVRSLAGVEGLEDIALTTNGIRLQRLAQNLRDAGLQRINVSLDALDPDLFKLMSGGRSGLRQVLDGIDAAQGVGLEVKVNAVIEAGVNESEVLPLARYFRERGICLRFIEYMDTGNSNGWGESKVVPSKVLRGWIDRERPLEPVPPQSPGEVARRYRYRDSEVEVGFISSVSEPFCGNCVRARVSAEGKLFTCLFASEGADVRYLLKEDVKHSERVEAFAALWQRRKDRYSELRSALIRRGEVHSKVEMSYIGG
ncbi:MAG: GTP 3',8-cyclase MoaA [Opitutales bacterium]|nr:GTP 3',8-cyclase MoaA [Opitutales bacterium]